MDTAVGIAVIWIAPLAAMLLVSVCYFRASRHDVSLGSRMLVSAHGAAGAVLLLCALALALLGVANSSLRTPYLVAWALPPVLIVVALWRFSGPRWIHALQLVNLAAMAWAIAVGFTAAGGGK